MHSVISSSNNSIVYHIFEIVMNVSDVLEFV